jgi:peptide/nickel transport system ATP-binding protein
MTPLHPYSEALFSASPVPDPDVQGKRIRLSGQIADVHRDGKGCIFKARCPRRIGAICDERRPDWQPVAGRRYRCHHAPEELRAIQCEGA